MNTYIVFDLEWNQASGRSESVPGMPFEIIEIGAVKLDSEFHEIDTFRGVVKPVVYPRIHFRTYEVINIGIDELRKEGMPFRKACGAFLAWCYKDGEAPRFCTWGEADTVQLQRNLRYYRMKSPFPYPFLYYDVQKLYSLDTGVGRQKVYPLDEAVAQLGIDSSEQFHRALDDAQYTAKVLQKIDMDRLKAYVSVDYFHLPPSRDDGIYLKFPDYSKYVSCAYDCKERMLSDKVVTDMICPRCNRILRKKLRWFTTNGRQHHCIAVCPEHGYVKGKIRIKHTDDDTVFAVKTIKLVNEDVVHTYEQRYVEAQGVRHEKNRLRKRK
jgi:inhibitor of KinA sporulation pathway (predicted exonuclease)